MQRTAIIRFLTTSTNKKGDLFTRLMKDFFRALGYDDLRLDVQKSGREIDIQGRHRHAPRLLRAECKAHEDKLGGTDLNTFFGAVTRERKKATQVIDAYFVSVSGFTEPGRDQEEETDDERLILLDGLKVIAGLEEIGLLPDDAATTDKAGQCASLSNLTAGMLDGIELIAYEKGYAKVVYYAEHGQRTHFALIHAVGTPLALAPAKEIIDADQATGGTLHQLKYLPPAPTVADLHAMQQGALAHYQRWLSTECAYVQLDGLPADSDVSASKLKLERLFVPLKAVPVVSEEPYRTGLRPNALRVQAVEVSDDGESWYNVSEHQLYGNEPVGISELLIPQARLAFLSPPGGGKSTLLKRLATEYGFTDQLVKFADDMPTHDWLPLVIRCRDLQDQAREPFIDILERLPKRLNMLPDLAAAFKTYLYEALQLGRVLLLIDGLDEIADESSRKFFTKNLLSFLALFPQVTLVLTSREAGFRLVADVVASECTSFKLAPFEEADVQRLCVQWHAEVVNYSEDVRQKALKLAQNIWDNEHIRGLATNPLLLTTLLVVNRRRGGELPKNRIMLYSKAVEVLIQTWNAEAHAPLDEDETLTQLSYLACYMMEKGIQQIDKRELVRILKQAQQIIPELRYTKTSPANFIKQVEHRSSLLMQVGSKLIDDEEQEVFEFRHLTFQEYLAARGYVEGYHPRNSEELSLSGLLAPHLSQTAWREIIPLAAVLAKRRAEELMEQLVHLCASHNFDDLWKNPVHATPVDMLRRCIADEVIITSDALLRHALLLLGRVGAVLFNEGITRSILNSKHADLYQQLVEQAYLSDKWDWKEYRLAFFELSVIRLREAVGEDNEQYIEQVTTLLRQVSPLERLRGLVALTELGEGHGLPWVRIRGQRHWLKTDALAQAFKMGEEQATNLYQLLDALLHEAVASYDRRLLLAVCEALTHLPHITLAESLVPITTIALLFRILGNIENHPDDDSNRKQLYTPISQALKALPLHDREALRVEDVGEFTSGDWRGELDLGIENRPVSSLLILAAWYKLFPLADEKLLQWIDLFYNTNIFARPGNMIRSEFREAERLLSRMGTAGEQLLAERTQRREQMALAK